MFFLFILSGKFNEATKTSTFLFLGDKYPQIPNIENFPCVHRVLRPKIGQIGEIQKYFYLISWSGAICISHENDWLNMG